MITETEALIAQLTEREREVVALVAEAARNQEIADRLGISVITVRHHLSSIFSTLQPLGVTDRTKLAVFAYQSGMATLNMLKPPGVATKEPLKTVIEEPVLPPATEFVNMVRSIVQAEIRDLFKTTEGWIPRRKVGNSCALMFEPSPCEPPTNLEIELPPLPGYLLTQAVRENPDAVKAAIRDSDAVSDIIKDKY